MKVLSVHHFSIHDSYLQIKCGQIQCCKDNAIMSTNVENRKYITQDQEQVHREADGKKLFR